MRTPTAVPTRITHDKASWEAGREDGRAGKNAHAPLGLDALAYHAGVIEGRADREKHTSPKIKRVQIPFCVTQPGVAAEVSRRASWRGSAARRA